MSNNYSYQVADSPLHNLNPTVKIISLLIFILACFFKYNYIILMAIVLITLINIIMSSVHIKFYSNIIFKAAFILAVLDIFLYRYSISPGQITVLNIKVIGVIVYLIMILYTTPADKLAKAFAKALDIFNFIGLNTKKIERKVANRLKKIQIKINVKKQIAVSQIISKFKSSDESKLANVFWSIKNRGEVKKQTQSELSEYEFEKKYKLDNDKQKLYNYQKRIGIFDLFYLCFHLGIIIFYILKVR